MKFLLLDLLQCFFQGILLYYRYIYLYVCISGIQKCNRTSELQQLHMCMHSIEKNYNRLQFEVEFDSKSQSIAILVNGK